LGTKSNKTFYQIQPNKRINLIGSQAFFLAQNPTSSFITNLKGASDLFLGDETAFLLFYVGEGGREEGAEGGDETERS